MAGSPAVCSPISPPSSPRLSAVCLNSSFKAVLLNPTDAVGGSSAPTYTQHHSLKQSHQQSWWMLHTRSVMNDPPTSLVGLTLQRTLVRRRIKEPPTPLVGLTFAVVLVRLV